MRLCVFFIVVLQFAAFARGNAQHQIVTLNMKNVSYFELFNEIHRQTGLRFIYNTNQFEGMAKINVSAQEQSVESVLTNLFADLPFSVTYKQNVVMVTKKADPDEEKKFVRVKGFVYDEKKQPMPGVTVQVMGTSVGTATTSKGWFAIDLPILKGKLRFTFVGYQDQEVEFSEESDTLRIYMKEEISDLEEVVVRAYGTQKKREVISAISRVTADEIKELPTASLVNLLQGRMAGVMVVNQSGAPGSAQMVAICGYNSLMTDGASDGQPLYVIDGVPMHSFVSPVSGTNTMADIDPAMIESVEVLKDAAAASIYGSRAGNGVILITTKKGRAGEAKFSANVSYSTSRIIEYPVRLGGRMERILNLERIKNERAAINDYTTRTWRWPTSYEEVYEMRSGTYDGFWGNGRLPKKVADYLQDTTKKRK